MKMIRQDFSATSVPVGDFRATGAQTNAESQWLYGTIRSVEIARNMLFLHRPRDSTDEIIHWLPQTHFFHHGLEVNPATLYPGQRISVQYLSDGGEKFAVEIDIVIEPLVADAAAAQRRSLWPPRLGMKAHG